MTFSFYCHGNEEKYGPYRSLNEARMGIEDSHKTIQPYFSQGEDRVLEIIDSDGNFYPVDSVWFLRFNKDDIVKTGLTFYELIDGVGYYMAITASLNGHGCGLCDLRWSIQMGMLLRIFSSRGG